MFFIKKMFNSPTKSKDNKNTHGCIESDAFPIEEKNGQQILQKCISSELQSSNLSHEVSEIPFSSENNTMNVNNVNQQVVVQFSNINGLQIGSTYNINKTCNEKKEDFNKVENYNLKAKNKYPKTITIVTMMKSQDEPNREILNEIATHLGGDYKNFMRELGFSDGQISAKIIDHNVYGVKEVQYKANLLQVAVKRQPVIFFGMPETSKVLFTCAF